MAFFRRAAIIVIALAVSSAACGSADVTTSPEAVGSAVPLGNRVEVAGRVIDFSTNAGVPGATVSLARYLQAPADGYRASTDPSGAYRTTVPSGDYWVYVNDAAIPATVFALYESPFRGDMLVNAAGCSARYGLVTESRTRRPIGNVTVSLIGYQAVTDASGWYRLDMGCLSSYGGGTVFIGFSRAGYADRAVIAGRREALRGLARIDATLQPR